MSGETGICRACDECVELLGKYASCPQLGCAKCWEITQSELALLKKIIEVQSEALAEVWEIKAGLTALEIL